MGDEWSSAFSTGVSRTSLVGGISGVVSAGAAAAGVGVDGGAARTGGGLGVDGAPGGSSTQGGVWAVRGAPISSRAASPPAFLNLKFILITQGLLYPPTGSDVKGVWPRAKPTRRFVR